MAPMVHWPEAMVTYDATTRTLFSADAFGTFGALSGNLFADEVDFERDWLDDARRYYVNIVGKIRHAGTGAAQEGSNGGHRHDLPAARARLAHEPFLVH